MNTTKAKYYQHPTFKHVYGLQIASPIGRLVYPSLIVPKEFKAKEGQQQQKSQPRYESNILIPKDDPKLPEFIEKLKLMTSEMLEVFNKGRGMKFPDDLEVLKDGDLQFEKDNEKYDFYKGTWILIARNANKPKTIDKNGEIDAGIFEGGMKVKALVTPMITTHGVSYRLETLKYISDDGSRFGGGVRDQSGLLAEDDDEAVPFGAESQQKDLDAALNGSDEEGESAPSEKKGKKSRSQDLSDSL